MSLSTLIPYIFPTRLHVVYPQKAFNRKDLLPLGSDYLWKIEQGIVRSWLSCQFGQTATNMDRVVGGDGTIDAEREYRLEAVCHLPSPI